MPKTQLYVTWYCPFAQRAWISMIHSGADFDLNEVNVQKKTPEWLAINPGGQVPAIVYESKLITDSRICAEFADEAFPNHQSLMPTDAYDRAYVRTWCDRIPKLTGPFFANMKARGKDADKSRDEINAQLLEFAGAMRDGGPYFMGKDFGLFDVLCWPFVLRLEVCAGLNGFAIPSDAKYDRIRTWAAAIRAREDVKPTIPDIQKIIDMYK